MINGFIEPVSKLIFVQKLIDVVDSLLIGHICMVQINTRVVILVVLLTVIVLLVVTLIVVILIRTVIVRLLIVIGQFNTAPPFPSARSR
jgi:hypothetical protein